MTPGQIHLFEPGDETHIIERKLPHWQQAGAISFITWQTHDSMPELVVKSWQAEQIKWLVNHQIPINEARQTNAYKRLAFELQREFLSLFQSRWMNSLDQCHGECVLRQQVLSDIVKNSFHHFDGQRYLITDYVIMPNHVHILVAFPDNDSMLGQCEAWKRFTSNQINRLLNRNGRFWQSDGFDHLVRSELQFRFLRDYIRDNPRYANLQPGEYVHFSRKNI